MSKQHANINKIVSRFHDNTSIAFLETVLNYHWITLDTDDVLVGVNNFVLSLSMICYYRSMPPCPIPTPHRRCSCVISTRWNTPFSVRNSFISEDSSQRADIISFSTATFESMMRTEVFAWILPHFSSLHQDASHFYYEPTKHMVSAGSSFFFAA